MVECAACGLEKETQNLKYLYGPNGDRISLVRRMPICTECANAIIKEINDKLEALRNGGNQTKEESSNTERC